jgi:hypothetical protein
MAVALVALVTAMSGGAYAATATSAKHHKKKPTFDQRVLKVFTSHHNKFVGPVGSTGPNGSTGSTGATGPANTTTYYQTVNTTGTGGASGPGVVTLATIGPFTIVGKCVAYNGGSSARTYIRTTQSNSALDESASGSDTTAFSPTFDSGQYQQGGQDIVGDAPFGAQADGTAGAPSFQQSDDGPTGTISGDGQTRLILEPEVGSYIGTPPAPACTFYGSIITAS